MNNTVTNEVAKDSSSTLINSGRGSLGRGARGGARSGRGGSARRDSADDGFIQRIVELARVTRVMAGGKRMRFRALVVLGNPQLKRVGYGLAKGADVSLAVSKATTQARKNLITVPLKSDTIPHAITLKYKSARILLKPAPQGTGIIAGGPVRTVLEVAGVPNVVSKILGSSNKINNIRAIFEAFASFKSSR